LIEESAFIEILLTEITEAVESLPKKLEPHDILGNLNLLSQLQEHSDLLLEKQIQDLFNACKLFHSIF
jgi:hypothetical protein